MKTTNFTSKKKFNNSNYFVRYFSQAFPEKIKKVYVKFSAEMLF